MSKDKEQPKNWTLIATLITSGLSFVAALTATGASIRAVNIGAESQTNIQIIKDDHAREIELIRNEFTREIELIRSDLQQQEINLSINRFEDDKSARRENILTTWVPLLVSEDESQQNAALAVLFALYPSEAEEILKTVKSSISQGNQIAFLDEAIESAENLNEEQGTWIIVTATLKTKPEAEDWIEEHEPENFSWSIYSFKEGYAPSGGPYPTKDAAEIALIGIRSTINPSAYLINLDTTCNDVETLGNGVLQCK